MDRMTDWEAVRAYLEAHVHDAAVLARLLRAIRWSPWGGVCRAARAAGVHPTVLRARVREGMTPAQAVAVPRPTRKTRSRWAPWGGLAAAAHLAGVTPRALVYRVATGCTPERAVGKTVRKRKRSIDLAMQITGYAEHVTYEILRAAGLRPSTATAEQIKAAARAHVERMRKAKRPAHHCPSPLTPTCRRYRHTEGNHRAK